jgi:hypothetical protein
MFAGAILSSARLRVTSRSDRPPIIGQNCFGRSSPAIARVKVFSLEPSPPARIAAKRLVDAFVDVEFMALPPRSLIAMVKPQKRPIYSRAETGLNLN